MYKKEEKVMLAKLDVIFQALFGEVGNENITKRFLESILKEKIEAIDLSKNPILRKEYQTDKLGILDVVATLNGNEPCNIEIQMENQPFLIERNLWYWSKRYSKQMQEGESYKKLHRTISILITNFDLEITKEMEYCTKWQIREEKNKQAILTKKFEFYIISLAKIKELEDVEGELLDWLFFLDNPKSERVVKKMEENKELKEASEKLEHMTQDEYLERIAELRQRAILDENTRRIVSYEEGEKTAKLETAKNLLKMGIEIEKIMQATGLSKQEIEQLQV